MMSKKKFFVLVVIYVGYMLIGALIFYKIEVPWEIARREVEREERREIEALLNKHYVPSDNETQEDIFEKLTEYCGKPMTTNMTDVEAPLRWDYFHSLFFVITVVSTIGYGNLSPTTIGSRWFMVFYALIGIPLNGIVMMHMGKYFGRSFEQLHKRWKKHGKQYDFARLGLITQVFLYLLPGLVCFLLLPAIIFMLYEGWSYEVSVYYAFVTLSTIGFGDYVAGDFDNGFSEHYYNVYKIFLLFWVIIGLGYLAMILDYITAGMQSEKVKELEHFIEDNLKKTPQKIRDELRFLLNEIILTNIKRVYKDEVPSTPTMPGKSQSCPDLTLWRNENSPNMARKRAFSECVCRRDLPRVQSDTDLTRIDIERTFSPAEALVQPSDLLLRVVSALGKNRDDSSEESDEEEGGVHGFSDSQILASEGKFGSNWTLGSQNNKPMPSARERRRAASEVRFPFREKTDNNDLTWYGTAATNKLQELRERVQRGQSRSRASSMQQPQSLPQTILNKLKNTFRNTNKEEEKSRNVDVEKQDYDRKSKGRPSIGTIDQDRYVNQTARGRSSIFTSADDPILESTSIAELVRALTAIASPEVTEATNPAPKRKLGTAGITPPRYYSPPRTRRVPIRSTVNDRRCSLIPPSALQDLPRRRFSLHPVQEATLLASTREEGELRLLPPPAVPQSVEGVLLQPPPPPYTLHDSSSSSSPSLRPPLGRRYSLKPSSISTSTSSSPVQRQVLKKDKDDKDNSSRS